VNSAGGPIETKYRQLFTALGMDPDKDVTLQPGTPETGNAAWRSGQLDTFSCCEPATFTLVPDAVIWVNPGEIDLPIKGYGTVLATTEQYAKANPEVLRRVIAVQEDMKKMILAALPGTKERDAILNALKEQYPTVDESLIAKSFDSGRQTFDVDNHVTRQGLQDSIDDYNVGAAVRAEIKPEDLGIPGFMN
jgi:ABC-type nitrate/sulfonate/bicarbonate transport system substrate-binding protein